ncbi:hypothetical protein CLF_104843 [Clonorchis sinensis]|uniref:Endonuclease/exonuclease/phosphatase domain-containing protein n=1 Tax=Clonorchis sinensis TaxID=79923 RepID=G7YCF6_CLOSI|nr:hypothetical protein CLF_104843 [Clonorchis sinensis]
MHSPTEKKAVKGRTNSLLPKQKVQYWLRQKGSKRTLGLLVTLFSPSTVQKTLGRAVSIRRANATIRRLSEDRPLDARKLGHSSSSGEVRKRPPDGASSADPKLKAKPIVVIAPCAPESTPRQTTATLDSSFYLTTAELWNSKGSDALEEASRGRGAQTEAMLKCLSTNCLRIFNKLCDIKQSVGLGQSSIIALTETWLTVDVSDAEILIDGYSVFRANSNRGRAGGVALYLHADLPISIVLFDTTPAPFCDALWTQAPLRGSDSLLLGVVYRCPSSPPEDDQSLIRTFGKLSSSYHFTHLLLVGDFNAPKAPWMEFQCVGSSGPFAAALTEVVQQSAWTQHVISPTRYRAGQQLSLLDLVITNGRHLVDQVIIHAPLGHSDHCVLTFDYRTIVQKIHEAEAMLVLKKPARSRMSRKLAKRIRRLLEKRSQLFFKKLTTGDTEDELAFRKMRNRCKSEIRQWNIRKQATILDLSRKNRNT